MITVSLCEDTILSNNMSSTSTVREMCEGEGNEKRIFEKYKYENRHSCISKYSTTFTRVNTITDSNDVNNFETISDDNDIIKNRFIRRNIDMLEAVSHLDDNWDGYGAAKIDKDIIRKANEIIYNLIYQPEIFPTGRSTIQLEFDKNGDYLEFEIYSSKITMFKEIQNKTEEKDNVRIEDIFSIVEGFYGIK